MILLDVIEHMWDGYTEHLHQGSHYCRHVILQRHMVVSNEGFLAERKEKRDAESLCVSPTRDKPAIKRFYVSRFSAGSHFNLQHKNK